MKPSDRLDAGPSLVSAAEYAGRTGVCCVLSGVNAVTADARLVGCPAGAATTSNVFPRASGTKSS